MTSILLIVIDLCLVGIDQILPNNSIIVYRATCTRNSCCNTPIANGFVQDIINYSGEEGIHICTLPGNESFLFAVHFGKLLLFPLNIHMVLSFMVL